MNKASKAALTVVAVIAGGAMLTLAVLDLIPDDPLPLSPRTVSIDPNALTCNSAGDSRQGQLAPNPLDPEGVPPRELLLGKTPLGPSPKP